jgi:hypothetical protein
MEEAQKEVENKFKNFLLTYLAKLNDFENILSVQRHQPFANVD